MQQFVILYRMGASFSVKTLPLDITKEQAEDIAKEEGRRAYKQAAEQCQILPEIRLTEADLWEHENG